jgi:uncharacterized protein YegP (UPF0339 family)
MAKFEMYESSNGEWRWRLVAPNGRTIADSGEGYSSKQSCEEGIESVRRWSAEAEVVELE